MIDDGFEGLSEDQQLIAEGVRKVCAGFDDDYWAKCDREHLFPWDYYAKMAEGGWLGLAIPEEYGGGGMGISEAAVMMREIALEWRGDERLLGVASHGVRPEPGRAFRQRPPESRVLTAGSRG